MTLPDNPHLAVAPVRAGAGLEGARLVAVLVHGRDQDERVMLDVAARLDLPDVAYLLPVAAGGTWYPGRYFDPIEANEPSLGRSLEALERAIAGAHHAGMGDEQIVLGGFSQGACLVAELVAARPRPFAGAAVLTGSLLGQPGTPRRPAVAPGLPMLFASSRHDEWMPFEDALTTAHAFRAAGADVRIEELDDREHHVSDRALAGLRALLTAGLSARKTAL